MSTYTSKELCKILEAHGWYEVKQTGSHKQFKHPDRPNKITVPVTQVKKNIEMNVLKQAGLRHLIKRRNIKAQLPKPSIPRVKPIITKATEATEGNNIMPTLGEISKVTVDQPKKINFVPLDLNGLTLKETIIKWVKGHPVECRNTTVKKIALKFCEEYDSLTPTNVASYMGQLIRWGKILRIPNAGKMYVGTFLVPGEHPKEACLPVAPFKPENVSVGTPLEAEAPVAETKVEAQPAAVDIKPTAEGIQLSITLNINLNMKK